MTTWEEYVTTWEQSLPTWEYTVTTWEYTVTTWEYSLPTWEYCVKKGPICPNGRNVSGIILFILGGVWLKTYESSQIFLNPPKCFDSSQICKVTSLFFMGRGDKNPKLGAIKP